VTILKAFGLLRGDSQDADFGCRVETNPKRKPKGYIAAGVDERNKGRNTDRASRGARAEGRGPLDQRSASFDASEALIDRDQMKCWRWRGKQKSAETKFDDAADILERFEAIAERARAERINSDASTTMWSAEGEIETDPSAAGSCISLRVTLSMAAI